MEIKVESRIGQLNTSVESIYSLLSDCNNFQQFIPGTDEIQDWRSDEESFSFAIKGAGGLSCRIVEKAPNGLIKFSIENPQAEDIFVWVQMKSTDNEKTKVKLTVKMNVSMMLSTFISKPLKQGLNKVIDTLEKKY
jgi:carbon monoxide dehydrogenase subunit G